MINSYHVVVVIHFWSERWNSIILLEVCFISSWLYSISLFIIPVYIQIWILTIMESPFAEKAIQLVYVDEDGSNSTSTQNTYFIQEHNNLSGKYPNPSLSSLSLVCIELESLISWIASFSIETTDSESARPSILIRKVYGAGAVHLREPLKMEKKLTSLSSILKE